MTATPQAISVEAAELERGGAFANLPVPIDLVARIVDVNDYDNTGKDGGTKGWRWELRTEGNGEHDGLDLPYWTSFSKTSRRKLVGMMQASGADVTEGVNKFNPNDAIDAYVGVRVDYPRDYYKARDAGTLEATGPYYKEIRYVFALSEEPEVEEADLGGAVPDEALEPVEVL